jgi:hypothetical protein
LVECLLGGLVAPDVRDLTSLADEHLPSVLPFVRHGARLVSDSQVNDEPIAVDGYIEDTSAAPLRLAALVPADHVTT